MIFLLYQTQHHQIWIEIDSTVTIYPQDENGWWRKDKSLPLSNSQNNCLSWWTISVTINKTLLFIPALIPDPKIRIRSHHRQKAEVATAQHHPPVVQTNERMPCTGEDLHTWGVAHQYHPVLAQLHKINLHMTIYLDSCTRPIQGLGCFFFFHPHSLSDVTSLNRPQISQRNFENSKLSVMSKAKTMQTREIHPTQADRSTKNNCILLNAQGKQLHQFQLDFSCAHLYQQMTVAKNVQIILKIKI